MLVERRIYSMFVFFYVSEKNKVLYFIWRMREKNSIIFFLKDRKRVGKKWKS